MTDLIAGRTRLERFKGLVACGGFSYGDVLGAGEGWAKSILFNAALREQFEAVLRAARQLLAGRLQWLPDDVGAEDADPRRGALAPLRAQPLGAIRGARRARRGAADAVDFLCRHGGLRVAHRRGARRRPGRICRVPRPSRPASRAASSACAGSTTSAAWPRRIPPTRMARPLASPASRRPTAALRSSCRIPSACSAPCRTRGTPSSGARTGGWMRMFRNARLWVD